MNDTDGAGKLATVEGYANHVEHHYSTFVAAEYVLKAMAWCSEVRWSSSLEEPRFFLSPSGLLQGFYRASTGLYKDFISSPQD